MKTTRPTTSMTIRGRDPIAAAAAALALAGATLGASATVGAQTTVLDGTQPPPLVSNGTPPSDGSGGAVAGSSAATAPSQPPANASSTVVAPAVPYGPRWGHRNQFELRVGATEGYQLAIRYTPGDACGPVSAMTFCSNRAPVVLDTAIGFGVTQTLEIEARFRTGEPGWNTAIPLAAGLGIRLYTDEASRLKLFGGVAVLVDFTGPGTLSSYATDLQARGEVGLQYEIAREFAIYVGAGATAGFLRTLLFGIDGGLGIQVRIP